MTTFENIETLMGKTMQDIKNRDFEEKSPDYIDNNLLYIHDASKIPEIYSSKMFANVICICMSGTMELILNGERCTLEKGDVLVCPSSAVVERPMISPDFKFSLVAFTDGLLRELLRLHVDVWNKAAYIRKGHLLTPASDRERELQMQGSMHLMGLLKQVLEHRELVFRREILYSLLQIVLLAYCSKQREIEQHEQQAAAPQSHLLASNTIFNNFMILLRQEKIKHRTVSYYANQLFITPKHLTFVCKQVSGRPAIEIIQATVTEEIVQYLRDPNYTVKQICEQLGFANISFFGKFVKKRLGVSPNDYRKQLLVKPS